MPLGKDGEQIAVKYLKSNGYKILDTNFRCAIGEIDIVAKEKDTIVIVEVKTRQSDTFAEPFESVGKRKQAKIKDLAEHYIQDKDYLDCDIRFDVLSITAKDKDFKIEHIKDAFI
jgi:putative endonuclease